MQPTTDKIAADIIWGLIPFSRLSWVLAQIVKQLLGIPSHPLLPNIFQQTNVGSDASSRLTGLTAVPMQAIGRFLPSSAVLEVLAQQHSLTASSAPLATHLVNVFKDAASNHSKRNCTDHVRHTLDTCMPLCHPRNFAMLGRSSM